MRKPSADDMHFFFITLDAADLRLRLAEDRPSPVSYDVEKLAELLEEDALISTLIIDIDAAAIMVLPRRRYPVDRVTATSFLKARQAGYLHPVPTLGLTSLWFVVSSRRSGSG